MIIVIERGSKVGGVRRRGGRRRGPLLPHQHRPLLQRTVRVLLRQHRSGSLGILHEHLQSQYSQHSNEEKFLQSQYFHKITQVSTSPTNSQCCAGVVLAEFVFGTLQTCTFTRRRPELEWCGEGRPGLIKGSPFDGGQVAVRG